MGEKAVKGERNKTRGKGKKFSRFLHKHRDAETENVILISHFFVIPSHSKNKLQS